MLLALAHASTPFSMAYDALSFAFNAYITLAICLRLIMLRPKLEAVSGKLHASFYTSTITLFVESGGFFTIWSAVNLITRSRGSLVQDVFFFPQTFALVSGMCSGVECLSESGFKGITRMLLILRIAQSRAWSRDLVQSVHRGVLEWQVSSTQSIPLHDVPSTSDFRHDGDTRTEKLQIRFPHGI
ncbi:hypothetical protein H0H92_003282 [Tricholoma furcatifolium]|nr:hypothetical protein H0H92_003282 [Tricholoma furcatifolium]